MLQNTFCHLSGIGEVKEKNLWATGITTWKNLLEELPFSKVKKEF